MIVGVKLYDLDQRSKDEMMNVSTLLDKYSSLCNSEKGYKQRKTTT